MSSGPALPIGTGADRGVVDWMRSVTSPAGTSARREHLAHLADPHLGHHPVAVVGESGPVSFVDTQGESSRAVEHDVGRPGEVAHARTQQRGPSLRHEQSDAAAGVDGCHGARLTTRYDPSRIQARIGEPVGESRIHLGDVVSRFVEDGPAVGPVDTGEEGLPPENVEARGRAAGARAEVDGGPVARQGSARGRHGRRSGRGECCCGG